MGRRKKEWEKMLEKKNKGLKKELEVYLIAPTMI